MNNITSLEDLIESINKNEKSRFKIKVVPNSKNNLLDFENEEYIKIKIKEKPIEGKANRAIVDYLSNALKIPKSRISIVNGEKSSLKLIEILK